MEKLFEKENVENALCRLITEVNKAHEKQLLGKLLTIIDATSEKEKGKWIKDLIKSATKEAGRDRNENLESLVMMINEAIEKEKDYENSNNYKSMHDKFIKHDLLLINQKVQSSN